MSNPTQPKKRSKDLVVVVWVIVATLVTAAWWVVHRAEVRRAEDKADFKTALLGITRLAGWVAILIVSMTLLALLVGLLHHVALELRARF